jgi:hypothetical protein
MALRGVWDVGEMSSGAGVDGRCTLDQEGCDGLLEIGVLLWPVLYLNAR